MTERELCLNELRALIGRADPGYLAAAQAILLRFTLLEDGAERRTEALDGLLADLVRDEHAGARSREQQAFHTVLLSMIARTRDMAGSARG